MSVEAVTVRLDPSAELDAAASLRAAADEAWQLCGADAHRALALARRVHRDAERHGDEVARALALRTEGRALQQLGRTEVAARVLRKAVVACAATGQLEAQIQALHGMYHVYRQFSDLDAAGEVLEEVAHLAAQAGDERLLAGARVNLAGLRLELGSVDAAAEDARAALRMGHQSGDARLVIAGVGNLGRALVLQGRPAEGHAAHLQALDLSRGLGDRLLEMCSLKYDGEALIALGDAAHAVEQLTSALELAHECSGGHDVAQTQRLLAVALADLGRLEEAEALLVEASHPQGTDAPRSRAEAYEALSRVRELRGDGTGALAAMREAWLALLEAERIESAGRAAASVIRFETVQARAAAERAAADATILAEANAALELAKTRAERALRIDPLTATTTRRHGVELLRRGLRARPDGLHRLGMLLVDIDRFKEVNDTWGHAAGDAVLAEVARQIKLSLRLGDVTVRWGGEEFLVLLPELDSLDVVQTVAERIRARVEARPVPLLTSTAATAHAAALSTAVTVSVGALFCTPPADSRSALAAVDAALYRAKAAGRNRVCAEVFDGS